MKTAISFNCYLATCYNNPFIIIELSVELLQFSWEEYDNNILYRKGRRKDFYFYFLYHEMFRRLYNVSPIPTFHLFTAIPCRELSHGIFEHYNTHYIFGWTLLLRCINDVILKKSPCRELQIYFSLLSIYVLYQHFKTLLHVTLNRNTPNFSIT